MKVLVTGATGLIGSAICARLSSDGHDVTAMIRPGSAPVPAFVSRVIALDMAQATQPGNWTPYLDGMEAVVNCVGVLQDGPRENTEGVHVSGPSALFLACEELGIRRVIHLSAIGVDRGQMSAFSETKARGDAVLMDRDLDWVILRPSVVLGRPVYGGSALFRGLAALPLLPVMKDTGALQIVQLEDVTATVAFFLTASAPKRVELELAGPQRLTVSEVVASYRRWLGWGPSRTFEVPRPLATLLYRAGDLVGTLGWRSPMRSTAAREIVRGAIGDATRWREMTGINPRSLDAALAAEPVTVQERWFAKLYFLKPLTFIVLALFWLTTGILSLTAGFQIGVDLMVRAQAGILAAPSVVAGAIADILVGLAIAYRPTTRRGLYAAIALSLFYIVAGTILLPELWKEPLGPLLKIWPILVLHLVALAILDER
ncbi:NAD-dependent epimerase/dehydratase family protein [Phyllobacterium salinisoli]|uniref:NAD-dependent epimerase/dehydratase family protein n=1 Tax=Phyllobacterium salinisoli TaxID=1899321 RepID=A0A368K8J3_9HYPH|nr:SDR family oxidoreductase [Phyllobacterium salinisoli]RCS25677.1 NAD-dependent epimerase/dehydratase family protein [Phyllobacterium salinisoli]